MIKIVIAVVCLWVIKWLYSEYKKNEYFREFVKTVVCILAPISITLGFAAFLTFPGWWPSVSQYWTEIDAVDYMQVRRLAEENPGIRRFVDERVTSDNMITKYEFKEIEEWPKRQRVIQAKIDVINEVQR